MDKNDRVIAFWEADTVFFCPEIRKEFFNEWHKAD